MRGALSDTGSDRDDSRRTDEATRSPGRAAPLGKVTLIFQNPEAVSLEPRVPVWLLCSTVFGSASGRIVFFDDAYRKGARRRCRDDDGGT